MPPYGGRIETEDRQLAAFLRQRSDRIARIAARSATAMLPIGGAAARRRIGRMFHDQLQEFARLLETYGEEAPYLFGERMRSYAMRRRTDGLSVRDAIEEQAHLLKSTVREWGAQSTSFSTLEPIISAFSESSGQIADVWLTFQRGETAGFQEAALLETIVHHLDEAIVVMEADGSVSFVTPALQQVLGVSPKVFIGLKDERLLSLLNELKFRKKTGQPFQLDELPPLVALRTRKPVFIDGIRLVRPGGEHAVLEMYAAPVFDEEEELRGAIVTIRDRTELSRKVEQLEAAFREVREMQTRLLSRSRLEAVGELAGSAAHALNNQLQVLSARSLRLLDVPEARDEAEAIARSVREISEVVGRLQEFASVRAPGKARPTDLVAALQTALSLTRTQFAPGTNVSIDAAVGRVPEVLAEEELAVEFITALLLGAKEALVTGGTIRLTVGVESRQVVVRIVTKNVRSLTDPELLFEPLAAGIDTHGLSLAVARQAVRRWGGNLEAKLSGDDLVFEMRLLPARERDVTVEETARELERRERVAPAPPMPIQRVLVVDDDADNAEVLSEFILDTGAQTGTANTAGEALALAREIRPQAALVDLLLPDASGWEVARRLKEDFPGIRIAVISGLAVENEPEAANVNAVFRKPVDPSTVLGFLGLGPGPH